MRINSLAAIIINACIILGLYSCKESVTLEEISNNSNRNVVRSSFIGEKLINIEEYIEQLVSSGDNQESIIFPSVWKGQLTSDSPLRGNIEVELTFLSADSVSWKQISKAGTYTGNGKIEYRGQILSFWIPSGEFIENGKPLDYKAQLVYNNQVLQGLFIQTFLLDGGISVDSVKEVQFILLNNL